VGNIGCVAERIIHGETGFVAAKDTDFVRAAIELLSDDALWRRQSDAARARQRGWGWNEAAAEFEKLIP
jgi:glycosyltransferase involved in cell wall biosynthesis